MKITTVATLAVSTLLVSAAVATAAPSHHGGWMTNGSRAGTYATSPFAGYPSAAYAYEPGVRAFAPVAGSFGTDPDANIRLELRRDEQGINR